VIHGRICVCDRLSLSLTKYTFSRSSRAAHHCSPSVGSSRLYAQVTHLYTHNIYKHIRITRIYTRIYIHMRIYAHIYAHVYTYATRTHSREYASLCQHRPTDRRRTDTRSTDRSPQRTSDCRIGCDRESYAAAALRGTIRYRQRTPPTPPRRRSRRAEFVRSLSPLSPAKSARTRSQVTTLSYYARLVDRPLRDLPFK